MPLKFTEAVERACEEPTLLDALSWICIWESERAIKQAHEFLTTGISTAGDGKGWDTCFKYCLKEVMEKYNEKPKKEPSDTGIAAGYRTWTSI